MTEGSKPPVTPLDTSAAAKQVRYRSEINQLFAADHAAHNWYRFVLSYPPHLVRDYLQRFGITSEHRVLDPFCGTGTTVVECKKLGIPSVGVEANPMAHFAGRVKVDWHPNPDRLLEHATQVANATIAELEQTTAPVYLRSLNGDQEKLILKNSISPLPLHKTLVLLEHLQQQADASFYDHERLALAKSVVSAISNLNFGPEVCVGRAKPDAPVVDLWLNAIAAIANDLHALGQSPPVEAMVHYADSRQLLSVLDPQSIDAVITSPPYPNEKDYTRTTRLESVLLGFIKDKADLRSLKQGLVRSNTRNVYTVDDDDRWVVDQPEVQRIANEIEARRISLGKTSGFERLYARATKLYFGGMARHLAELRQILRPGAQLAYVVGDQASYLRVMIRTGQILADIARSLGYEVVAIDLFRTRIATATNEQMREEVVVLRWPG
ncbi:DNA methyltransferase [Stenomitos frigidus]|uniref:site-specific DNA-methyltransferase (cytosine-N(4)-specific) n=1 Tax=Stenomitos frigidus ULC18 TaxID=2107698 RepID=A0A2T1EBJ9_9CYAN|nr:DNA methyltransferase [Stenomitos frigidus]PSB30065.1 DNA methyltransferase [Stenomitos frigidus ULC18]